MKVLQFLFTSSIGRKVLMALTGLFLILFLVIHLLGNLQLLKADDGYAFNKYAWFMTTNPLIKTVSYLLYATILLHAFKGLYLAYTNRKARGSKSYGAYNGNANSHWTSRNMGILGTLILAFIIGHMSDFWWEYKFGDIPWTKYETSITDETTIATDITAENHGAHIRMGVAGDKEVFITKDLYKETAEAFEQGWLVALYVLAMAAIAFHLWHGFASAFQTLGMNHPRWNPLINGIGKAFSVLVPAAFAIIPLYVYLLK
ncbi:MAG: succinate dehydrogenase cytochrome b subunit [Bacteroidetes bacterium]|nr:succinate dehydrogenase cytochrome b subunit [Bacteroidota bacterium]